MKSSADFKIVAEYSGKMPNWGPMASAFAIAIEETIDDDGNFKDPALDAEFQEWLKERRDKSAGRLDRCEENAS